MWNLPINVRTDSKLGYQYFCCTTHPLASKGGKVYYHRHVASIKEQRWLSPSDIVHHIDGNRLNNDPNNLMVMTNSAHAVLHGHLQQPNLLPLMPKLFLCKNCGKEFSAMEFRKYCSHGCRYSSKNYEARKYSPKSYFKSPKEYITCSQCGKDFPPKTSTAKFCSYKCDQESRKKFDPSYEELKELVWKMPTTHVAKIFNVSDKAIEKRCKKLGIEKPPRGYWEKLKHGKVKEEPIDYSI